MIQVPEKRSLALRLAAPIGNISIAMGQKFEIRAELLATGLDSCSIDLELDPVHFSEVHEFKSPLRLRGKKTVIDISYTVSARRRTPKPGVFILVARGNGAVQRAQFSVEVL